MRECSIVSAWIAVVLLHGAALAYAQAASSTETDVLQAIAPRNARSCTS